MPDDEPVPDLSAFLAAFQKQSQEVLAEARKALETVGEEAQYRFDQEFAKALAKHPELYAELKRSVRQAKRTLDAAVHALGLK